jgi:hypothetical protein
MWLRKTALASSHNVHAKPRSFTPSERFDCNVLSRVHGFSALWRHHADRFRFVSVNCVTLTTTRWRTCYVSMWCIYKSCLAQAAWRNGHCVCLRNRRPGSQSYDHCIFASVVVRQNVYSLCKKYITGLHMCCTYCKLCTWLTIQGIGSGVVACKAVFRA